VIARPAATLYEAIAVARCGERDRRVQCERRRGLGEQCAGDGVEHLADLAEMGEAGEARPPQQGCGVETSARTPATTGGASCVA
jgi:hypothetical protein